MCWEWMRWISTRQVDSAPTLLLYIPGRHKVSRSINLPAVLSPLILSSPPENIGSHLCVHLLLPVVQVDAALPQQHLLTAGDGEHTDIDLELLSQQLTLYGGG